MIELIDESTKHMYYFNKQRLKERDKIYWFYKNTWYIKF